jgi:hypothetical protein
MRTLVFAVATLAGLLWSGGTRAENQTTPVEWACKERVIPGTARKASDRDDYLQACIQGWLPRHLAASARTLKSSGRPSVTAYAASGEGAACGPEGDDEGGDVMTSFIALVPVTGDDRLSKLVLKIETTLSFCHEKAQTRLTGAITGVTTIR